ncbi:MAG TPA: hypothetical protein VF322_07760 [Gammaproteobacteria bacterium]
MNSRPSTQVTAAARAGSVVAALALAAFARGGAAQPAGPSPRDAAPIDLTGQWVSVVTEDWLWRMVTPAKGDYASVPLNEAGRAEADRWDPVADEGTCRPYGAPNLLRMPTRVRIEWRDDATLVVETDAGRQSRLLHFESVPAPGEPTRQGISRARWQGTSLEVVTTNLLPGYLRRNGVPYSGNTVLTEHFVRHSAFGEEWFTVTTIVDDPMYLEEPFVTSSSFKREQDGAGWSPAPCEER